MDKEIFTALESFDEYHRYVQEGLAAVPRLLKAYIETLRGYEDCHKQWKLSVKECKELSVQVTNLQKELQQQLQSQQNLQYSISEVRKLLDKEKRLRKLAENDRDFFEGQATQFSDILKDNINKLSRETKEQFTIMKKNRPSTDILGDDRLEEIAEFETTGSMISDLSYTRDEDDLDVSSSDCRGQKRQAGHRNRKGKKKRRSSSAMRFDELLTKSSNRVVTTTTVTVDRSNIHATAVIETKPDSDDQENLPVPSAPPLETEDEQEPISTPLRTPLSTSKFNSRTHSFQQKATLKSETCSVCNKRIRFSTMSVKCRDCKTVCHNLCRDKAPLPCIPNRNTPGKSFTGDISNYAPLVPPMVPSIVVHCINEVEARGLKEVGIYRISGSEKEVRALKEKFLNGRGTPNLSQVADVHVICSTLKDFLRSLKDPLTTKARWNDFAKAIDETDEEERRQQLYRLIAGLPQPNRDTLAYIVLHLQKVAQSPDCKMPLRNLSSVFGPTIIGYSCNELETMFNETRTGNKIMEEILSLPSEFWEPFLKIQDMRKTNSDFFNSPCKARILKKIRYFETP